MAREGGGCATRAAAQCLNSAPGTDRRIFDLAVQNPGWRDSRGLARLKRKSGNEYVRISVSLVDVLHTTRCDHLDLTESIGPWIRRVEIHGPIVSELKRVEEC